MLNFDLFIKDEKGIHVGKEITVKYKPNKLYFYI